MEVFFIIAAIIGIPSALFGLYQLVQLFMRRGQPVSTEALEEHLQDLREQLKRDLRDEFNHVLSIPEEATKRLVDGATLVSLAGLQKAIDAHRREDKEAAIGFLRVVVRSVSDPAAQLALMMLIGNGYLRLSRLAEAERYHTEALNIAAKIGDRVGQASASGNLGIVYLQRGDLDASEEYHKRALDIDEKFGNASGQATQLGNLGNVYVKRSEFAKAEDFFRRAIEMDGASENQEGLARHLGNLGVVKRYRNELDEAQTLHRRSLEIHTSLRLPDGQASQLNNIGLVLLERGLSKEAESYFEEAIRLHRQTGNRHGEANALANLGSALFPHNAMAARGRFSQALHIFQDVGDSLAQAQALSSIGMTYGEEGNLDEAQRLTEQALALHLGIGNREGEATCLSNLANIARLRRDKRRALELFGSALTLYKELGIPAEVEKKKRLIAEIDNDPEWDSTP